MPLEMLKAQAIVARTYAAYQRQLSAAKLYHIVASTAHQQYVGRVAADSPVWTAGEADRRGRCCSGRETSSRPSTTPTAAVTRKTPASSSPPPTCPP